MDISLSWVITTPGIALILGTVAGLALYINRAKWQAIAIIAVVLFVAAVLFMPMDWILYGLALGVILGLIGARVSVAAIAIAAFVAAGMFFYGLPRLLSMRTAEGVHAQGIHEEALKYVDAAQVTLKRQNQPVVDRARAGELNLEEQGQALLHRGTVGNTQIENEERALLQLQGKLKGDFTVPAAFAGFNSTGKSICVRTTYISTGEVDLSPLDRDYPNHQIEPFGDDSQPRGYEGFTKLHPEAPLGALLLRVGRDGPIYYSWGPHSKERYKLTVPAIGCEVLYAAVNDYVKDASGVEINYHSVNKGGFPVEIVK